MVGERVPRKPQTIRRMIAQLREEINGLEKALSTENLPEGTRRQLQQLLDLKREKLQRLLEALEDMRCLP